MQKVWESWTLFYHFLMRGDWKKIQLGSGRPQQAFWMDYRLWITPYECFQFWNFWQKLQSLYEVWGAASRLLALGLSSAYVCQWIRVEIQANKSMFWWIKYLIFNEIFFNIFIMKPSQFAWNLSSLGMHEILRPWWDIILHKKIWKPYFSIFLVINFD